MKKFKILALGLVLSLQAMAVEPFIREERGISAKVTLDRDEYIRTEEGNIVKMQKMKEILKFQSTPPTI